MVAVVSLRSDANNLVQEGKVEVPVLAEIRLLQLEPSAEVADVRGEPDNARPG